MITLQKDKTTGAIVSIKGDEPFVLNILSPDTIVLVSGGDKVTFTAFTWDATGLAIDIVEEGPGCRLVEVVAASEAPERHDSGSFSTIKDLP